MKLIDCDAIEKILVTRVDRIGDVVLSTPVLEALRTRFPLAHLAMMVSRETRDLVEGNPYLDEVIVYDKHGREKSWKGTWRFSTRLRSKNFDLVIHLHPTNRVHWVSFLAGIPVRMGYQRKNYRLLTHRIPHLKHEGAKHEAEYNFDLVKLLGIEPPASLSDIKSYVPLHETAYNAVEILKREAGLEGRSYIAINPGASCPSKMWPASRFAKLADMLFDQWGVPVVFIGGDSEKRIARQIAGWSRNKPMDFTGRLTLGETAWILKGADLLISNDSGPVHIASALGTPVISIFGRKQPGLSPRRWGPLGRNSTVIHKDVGCVVCEAHRCAYSFLCLDAISVEEVFKAVEPYQTSTHR